MSEQFLTFRDDPNTARISAVVQSAADTAFRARVATTLTRRFLSGSEIITAREEAGLSEERWFALSMSTRNATSPSEFQAFARALSVSPRWLATGSSCSSEPPTGWYLFGSHVDQPDVPLEFSAELGEDLLPLWERPRESALV